jgi:asparagine synthase (glutamine-hydrolysing)
MCGIAVYLGDEADSARAFVRRANALQAHRGPDGEGEFFAEGIGFAHRRLAIVDLTPTGNQPMCSDNGRWVLVYNGEIYNHEDLRRELSGKWRFRGRSDAETVLAGLATWGPEFFQKMVGMWALALWDGQMRTLLVSRDRYGQKPLYWRRDGEALRFASEIKPLLEPGRHQTVDPNAMAEYLATGNYGHLGTTTFFNRINAFPPAHWAVVSSGETDPIPRRYWRFPVGDRDEAESRHPFSRDDAEGLRNLLERSVESQLMSDVPLGATLSGGLDSSVIVGLIAGRKRGSALRVFTAQTPASRYDETRYVESVQKRWGDRLEIHQTPLSVKNLRPALVDTVRQQEEPFGDPSIVAHGLLMDAARREGVPVVLGGQGADELFLGYRHMQYAAIAAGIRQGRLMWAARQLLQLEGARQNLPRLLLASFSKRVEDAQLQRSRQRRRRWLGRALVDAAPSGTGGGGWADWRDVWVKAVEGVAIPHLVHYDDRSAMARSVEGRMPFLDHRLPELLASFDVTAFIRDGLSKWPLRQACADIVPRDVLERKDKIGFFTPLSDLLRIEASWVKDTLMDPRFLALGWIDSHQLMAGCAATARGTGSAVRIWRAFCAALWASEFDVTA